MSSVMPVPLYLKTASFCVQSLMKTSSGCESSLIFFNSESLETYAATLFLYLVMSSISMPTGESANATATAVLQ